MKILYANKKLRDLCEKRRIAEQRLGDACAAKLRIRLVALETVLTVTQLVAGHPHPMKGDRLGQFALDLAGGCRLVFSPANNPCPTNADGSVAWSQVTIICIEYIGDYHD